MKLDKVYGSHISKSKGIKNILNYIVSLNLRTLQIFTKSPNKYIKLDKNEISMIDRELINKYIKDNDIRLFIHAQYILNLCRTDLTYNIHSIIEDFEYLDNVQGIVIHMGKDTKNLGYQLAFDNMKNNILNILSHIADKQSNLILEFAVKSKNDICNFSQIEGLAKLYNSLEKHNKVKFCIDTCHIFASGYDIRTPKLFDKFIEQFDNLIGIQNIQLIHLNDSKNICNSSVDRHEILGNGYIFKNNEETLKHILIFAIKNNISVITETDQFIEEEYSYLLKLFSE